MQICRGKGQQVVVDPEENIHGLRATMEAGNEAGLECGAFAAPDVVGADLEVLGARNRDVGFVVKQHFDPVIAVELVGPIARRFPLLRIFRLRLFEFRTCAAYLSFKLSSCFS
jgi:hypothetical protein